MGFIIQAVLSGCIFFVPLIIDSMFTGGSPHVVITGHSRGHLALLAIALQLSGRTRERQSIDDSRHVRSVIDGADTRYCLSDGQHADPRLVLVKSNHGHFSLRVKSGHSDFP